MDIINIQNTNCVVGVFSARSFVFKSTNSLIDPLMYNGHGYLSPLSIHSLKVFLASARFFLFSLNGSYGYIQTWEGVDFFCPKKKISGQTNFFSNITCVSLAFLGEIPAYYGMQNQKFWPYQRESLLTVYLFNFIPFCFILSNVSYFNKL